MEATKTLRQQIFTNKYLPVGLTALHLIFFFYLLPIAVAEAYTTLFALVGGVVSLILSFWVVGVLAPKLFEKMPVFMGLLCISTLFIFAFCFISRTSNFVGSELKEYGTYTQATITDKTMWYGRKGNTTQSIDVQFTTKENRTTTANILVTRKYYEYLSEGMQIPIVYSYKHPNIAEINFNELKLR